MQPFGDVSLDLAGHIATVEIHRPPENYFDAGLIASIADAYQAAEKHGTRAIVLCSQGKHFCAGANFTRPRSSDVGEGGAGQLYDQAIRLFEAPLPVVAAVQGAAIGGGLGLACSADFRVAGPLARFSANFARLGLHQGFGLSETLLPIVGQQRAWDLLYTGRRVDGEEAVRIGLADRPSSRAKPHTS
jgi:2-(1,2-epoxy-1,2-dihydrophenyl)acetyl-CoA isomerase